MKRIMILAVLGIVVSSAFSETILPKNQRLSFQGVEYFHRQSENGQHQFTPAGQENLAAWEDMLTIITLPQVTSPEILFQLATDLPPPFRNLGDVIGMDMATAVGATPEAAVLAFQREGLLLDKSAFVTIELSVAKAYMADQVGVIAVYSHRPTDVGSAEARQATQAEIIVSAGGALKQWDSEEARQLIH